MASVWTGRFRRIGGGASDPEVGAAESAPRTAVLASQNANKACELARVLPGWEIVPLADAEFPPEEGSTYYDNALAKARFGRALVTDDRWVLGEDSGIEVGALGGRPGIESARWADDGVRRVLEELREVEKDARGARYVCELVGIGPGGEELRGRGELAGRIAAEPLGSEGFGYDPIFVPEGERRTVAELGNEWKAENSHRARAARALLAALRRGPAPPRARPGGASATS